jgi:predicted DNA-binding transcriptional regulator AlpA
MQKQTLPETGFVEGKVLWNDPKKNYLGIFGQSRSWVLQKIKDGELPHLKPIKMGGRSVRYRVEDVLKQIEALSSEC